MNHNRDLYIFRRNIRFLRFKNRLTPKQMSDRIGVSTGTVRKLEKDGPMPRISSALLLRICDSFALSADELLHEDLAGAFLSQRP